MCKYGLKGPFCCTTGYFGETCTLPCPPNCAYCVSFHYCIECNYGFFGEMCVMCPDHCHQCSSSVCCSECQIGYYGTTCTKQCPPGCNINRCEKVTGKCLNGCRDNYNGMFCSKCTSGYHGAECTQTCSAGCVAGLCIPNGKCELGCNSDKYIGDNCCLKNNTNCTTGVKSGIGNLLLCSISKASICGYVILQINLSRTLLQFLCLFQELTLTTNNLYMQPTIKHCSNLQQGSNNLVVLSICYTNEFIRMLHRRRHT